MFLLYAQKIVYFYVSVSGLAAMENSKADLWPKYSQCDRPLHILCVATLSPVSSFFFSNTISLFFLFIHSIFLLFLSFSLLVFILVNSDITL